MQYIGQGSGSRGFRALFAGKNHYTPEKIAPLSDEILIEKSFSQRLFGLLSPYFDGDLRLHNILPTVSPSTGSIHGLGERSILWKPRTHILELPLRLSAALIEGFSPELLQKRLYYFASSASEAAAFCSAFPIEAKSIGLPPETPSPGGFDAEFFFLDGLSPRDSLVLTEKFMGDIPLRLDAFNLLRTFGVMASIIHAVFEAGREKHWFYGDDFNLAVPADNLEYVAAAYYLARAGLPIRKVLAISSNNRLAYNFLSSGGYNPSAVPAGQAFSASLVRLLYEFSKGSMPKVEGWLGNFRQKGSFVVDAGTKALMSRSVEAHFAGKNLLESKPPCPLSKGAHAAYTLSLDYQIPTFIIEEESPVSLGAAPKALTAEGLLHLRHSAGY